MNEIAVIESGFFGMMESYKRAVASGMGMEHDDLVRSEFRQILSSYPSKSLAWSFIICQDSESAFGYYDERNVETVAFWALYNDINAVLFAGVLKEDCENYLANILNN